MPELPPDVPPGDDADDDAPTVPGSVMTDAPLPTAGAVAPPAPEPLCASADLAERGRAFVWDVMLWGRPARAFALRFDGRPVAYLNRCVHVPTEMDWQEGEFLDMDKRWILCSIHGAAYEPADGRCVGGPCGRGKLTPVPVEERGGQVYWYPSSDIKAVTFDEPPPAAAATDEGAAPAAASPPTGAGPAGPASQTGHDAAEGPQPT